MRGDTPSLSPPHPGGRHPSSSEHSRLFRPSTMAECEPLDLRSSMSLVMSISGAGPKVSEISETQQQGGVQFQKSITKKRQALLKKKTAMIMRSIIISAVNLILNLPAHILRTWLTIDEPKNMDDIMPVLERKCLPSCPGHIKPFQPSPKSSTFRNLPVMLSICLRVYTRRPAIESQQSR